MLSKLLPVILLLVGTAGGIGAGIVMAPAPEEHAQEGAEPVEEDQKESEEEKEPTREFVKMTSQFVVPVVEREKLSSLVVISLSLEANIGLTEKIHAYEPKLRDMFLQVLFDHANMGGFNGAFTRSDMLTPLRTALREAAQKELGKDIHDVLIVEMSRQDV
ncbi:flagellar basal body-associated protein FliL [Phaeobacter italicus]|uniref:flagellar basal body-associated protein FliL n=1 Tax=Phaeobacter italicus TaxID=481446 RepID=UPI0035126FDA